jgi:hypothetical protein
MVHSFVLQPPNGRMSNRENNSVFLYFAYLKQVILKSESGIPALQLNYATLSRSVAGRRIELPSVD